MTSIHGPQKTSVFEIRHYTSYRQELETPIETPNGVSEDRINYRGSKNSPRTITPRQAEAGPRQSVPLVSEIAFITELVIQVELPVPSGIPVRMLVSVSSVPDLGVLR